MKMVGSILAALFWGMSFWIFIDTWQQSRETNRYIEAIHLHFTEQKK